MYFNNGMRRALVDFENVENNKSQIECVLVAISGWTAGRQNGNADLYLEIPARLNFIRTSCK